MKDSNEENITKLRNSIIEMAVESWRMKFIFSKMASKLDLSDQAKYSRQYMWFVKKVEESLDNVGYKTINLEGQEYDVGMAVEPINIDEFKSNEKLIIEQMLIPIIMCDGLVIKTGSVILRREN